MKFLLNLRVVLTLLFFIGSLHNEINFFESNKLEIYFLDIGQGDSILIKTPDNQILLVDAGETNAVVSKLSEILPFGFRTIDYFMISHFDLDHYGGAVDVLENYEVKNLIYSDYYEDTQPVNYFFSKTKDIPRINFSVNENLRIGCCTYLRFYWPEKAQDADKNDLSISFELVYKNFQMLSLGDASDHIEEQIAQNNWIDLDVLKVSHHGSKTSSSIKFIQLSKPELAVISAGRNNKFKHPSPEILENFEVNKVQIRRTDLEGTINISSNGSTYN